MQPKPVIVNVGPQLFHSPQSSQTSSQFYPSSHSAHPMSSHQPMYTHSHTSHPPSSHSSHPQHSHPAPKAPTHTSNFQQHPPSQYEDDGYTEHTTVPLEPMSISPKLATTLEHIVSQLDVLTQVRCNIVGTSLCGHMDTKGGNWSKGPNN